MILKEIIKIGREKCAMTMGEAYMKWSLKLISENFLSDAQLCITKTIEVNKKLDDLELTMSKEKFWDLTISQAEKLLGYGIDG